MKRSLSLLVITFCLYGFAAAQNQKPWSEWDKKQVEKMLTGSPWGQTQNETYAGQLTAQIGTAEPNQALIYNYRIRLFSARPIREAYARQVMLANPNVKASQLENFVIGDYSEDIVIAVTIDGTDRRTTGPVEKALAVATTATLAKVTYLERKDGKRVELAEYAPPGKDGTGAKFRFPRMLDGKPFVSGDDTFRFVAGLPYAFSLPDVKPISWRFKLSDLMYNGNLEY
jgi:hypothetical protein